MGRPLRYGVIAIVVACWLGAGLAPVGGAAAAPLLRIVHASSDAPAIDVYLDGQRVTTAPRFAAVTPYTSVQAGNANVRVLAAGAGPGGAAFIDTMVNLREGEAYTIVAADRVGQMAPVILTDTLGAVADGKSRVRLIHVSPDAPPVADVAVVGGPVVARNLPFKGATDYLVVEPGTYAFEVRPAGTAQALATTPAITLDADRSYSAFVMGQLGDGTFRAVITQDNAGSGGVGGAPSTGGGGMATSPQGTPAPLGLIVLGLAAALVVVIGRTRRAFAASRGGVPR